MKTKRLLVCLLMLGVQGSAWAQSFDDHRLLLNLGLYSDYRQYGRTQTEFKPTVQLGLSYHHLPSGFYVGVWGSGVHWIGASFEGGSGNTETNLFLGRAGKLFDGSRYDVGIQRIDYLDSQAPGIGELSGSEVYARLSAGPVYGKYTHAITDRPGIPGSKHSGIIEFGLEMDVSPWVQMTAHVGYDHLRGKQGNADNNVYWKAGLARFIDGPNFWIGIDVTQSLGKRESVGGRTQKGDFTGKLGPVLYLTKTF